MTATIHHLSDRKPIFTGEPISLPVRLPVHLPDYLPCIVTLCTPQEAEVLSHSKNALGALLDFTASPKASDELIGRVSDMIRQAQFRLEGIGKGRAL